MVIDSREKERVKHNDWEQHLERFKHKVRQLVSNEGEREMMIKIECND